MVIVRRLIFIIVLLGLAFVFYRFLNPEGADNLIAKLRGTQISSTISDPQNQAPVSTWGNLTWIALTWNITNTWMVSTWIVKTWSIQTWAKASWEIIWLVDNMSWFSEIIDSTVSTRSVKWDLNYRNLDYNFSMTFPSSWAGYTIEINTGTNIKSEFIFSFDKKDYFIIYVISNNYYKSNKTSTLNYLTYLAQDTNNTLAYKILENSDAKSKAVPYILKTFKLTDSIPPLNINPPIKPKPTTISPTIKKTNSSDWNYIKNIFDSFVK